METGKPSEKKRLVSASMPKLPLWIIEYAWVHKMKDIHEVIDPADWVELDRHPLTLKEPWRLRVASAHSIYIMKSRDFGHFEKVMSFLEATYRLLPKLVTPIKHMKIMFGLKTMVIIWMLREGQGMVQTVFKICQFFPSKLPQYQNLCSHHDMFLMRKNHQDFKAMAHALAMDKEKLENYIKNHMERQYGEQYAQKLEDRLLNYLQELEAVLPRDTYFDKLLKKELPLSKEEKLLLEALTFDSNHRELSLKRLHRHYAASCCPSRYFQKTGLQADTEYGCTSKAAPSSSSSEALLTPLENRDPAELQPVVTRREEAAQDLSKSSPLLLSDEVEHEMSWEETQYQEEVVGGQLLEMVEDESKSGALEQGEDCDVGEEGNTAWQGEGEERSKTDNEDKVGEQADNEAEKETIQWSAESPHSDCSTPQFCSKHKRWVRSILWECSDDCKEELPLHRDVTISPPLFQSSSSTSSSQDLTPSLCLPCASFQQRPPSSVFTPHWEAAQVASQTATMDKLASSSAGQAPNHTQTELLPQLSSKGIAVATLLSPVDPQKCTTSDHGKSRASQLRLVSPSHATISSNTRAASASPSLLSADVYCHTSRNKEAVITTSQTVIPPNSTVWKMTSVHPSPVVQSKLITSVAIHMSEEPPTALSLGLPITCLQKASLSHHPPTSTNCQPPVGKCHSRLSRKFQNAPTILRHSQDFTHLSHISSLEVTGKASADIQSVPPLMPADSNAFTHATQASSSTAQSSSPSLSGITNPIPLSTRMASETVIPSQPASVPQAADASFSLNYRHHLTQPQILLCTPTVTYTSVVTDLAPDVAPSEVHRVHLKLSLQSQAVLLQSKLLQPYVKLTRLSQLELSTVTGGRSPSRILQSADEEGCDDFNDDDDYEGEEEGENQGLENSEVYSSFDLNLLYSSNDSSCSDNEDLRDSDTDYIPCKKKTYFHKV